ncbi:hypothetical protein [Pseudomonas sp. W2-17]|uniref:Imm32 family immunity protein n=1 Tax=Pseudomonas sp. W2-17 TaxID=3058039 RepID=UPI0034E0DA8C
MKNLTAFTVHGTATGSNKNIQLDEISIIADSETMRALGNFLIIAADEMAQFGLEHLHLQDLVENFSHETHVDFIALNREIVEPTKG